MVMHPPLKREKMGRYHRGESVGKHRRCMRRSDKAEIRGSIPLLTMMGFAGRREGAFEPLGPRPVACTCGVALVAMQTHPVAVVELVDTQS